MEINIADEAEIRFVNQNIIPAVRQYPGFTDFSCNDKKANILDPTWPRGYRIFFMHEFFWLIYGQDK